MAVPFTIPPDFTLLVLHRENASFKGVEILFPHAQGAYGTEIFYRLRIEGILRTDIVQRREFRKNIYKFFAHL